MLCHLWKKWKSFYFYLNSFFLPDQPACCPSKGGMVKPNGEKEALVVYFDQRIHACTCVPMVENDQKHDSMFASQRKAHGGK